MQKKYKAKSKRRMVTITKKRVLKTFGNMQQDCHAEKLSMLFLTKFYSL